MSYPVSLRACSKACFVPVAALLWLSGCSPHIFRHEPIWGSDRHVVSVDAKQRAILVSGKRFCSEPSPDVFAVVAQALSAGGTLRKSVDPKAIEAALQAAFSSAEQGSTIPRTQTINMLRELMFRTCERYLNGGISGDELAIQSVRDQRLMVSILAIEQLTGAVLPHPVAISATASASTGGGGGEAMVRLDDARKELQQATAARTAAQSQYDQLDTKEHRCQTLEDAAKAAKDDTAEPQSQADQDALEQCRLAQKALADARDRETRATEHHGDLRRLSLGLGGSTATDTSQVAGGGLDQGRQISDVVPVIQQIISRNFTDGTEVMLFCLRNLERIANAKSSNSFDSDPNKGTLQALQSSCLEHLKAVVDAQKTRSEADQAEAEADKARFAREVAAAQRDMLSLNKDTFTQSWGALRARLSDPQKRQALLDRVRSRLTRSERAKADCLAVANPQEAEILACYEQLPQPAKNELLKSGD